jgi:hypothetical protein
MGTRGGGIGVIPIIGVIRIILITLIPLTITISQITRAHTTVTMLPLCSRRILDCFRFAFSGFLAVPSA